MVLDNAPTVLLFILGAALLSRLWWPLAVVFLAYCATSIVLFWALICPSCHHYGTRACPCGYGAIAQRLFERKAVGDFKRAFKRNIGFMFPCWFAPLIGGAYLLWADPSRPLLGLFLAFGIVGFIVIPAIARFVGCRGCDIKDQCPWMGRGVSRGRE